MLCKRIFITWIVVLLLLHSDVCAQTSSTSNEFWPQVNTSIELLPKFRVELEAAKQSGEDLARTQKKFGVIASYRMKRLIKGVLLDIDDEKNYAFIFGAGYEHLFTDDNGSEKSENRIVLQGVPHYSIRKTGLLIQDRNRFEFRWVNNVYSTRYRNRLHIERPFQIDKFKFSPYASGELFFDGQHHKWNENQYAFGVILPYKKLFSIDAYYLRQNCTTCKEEHVNVIGLTITIFLDLQKKKKPGK